MRGGVRCSEEASRDLEEVASPVRTDNAKQRCTHALNCCPVVDGRLPDTDAHLARVSALGAENMREHLVAVTTAAARAFAKLRRG